AGQEAADVVFHELFALLRAIGTSPIPIAAAITGHSVGGGALPPRALRLTRAAARRELAHAFAEFGWEELDELAAGWSGEETQKAIRAWLDRRATPLE
nr:hypothetical protein [Gammaproteobacteria bacterium]